MAKLELEVFEISRKISKARGTATTLVAGDKLKLEIGEDELDEVVPDGEIWDAYVQIEVAIRES